MNFRPIIWLFFLVVLIGLSLWGYFTSALPAPLPAWHRATSVATPSPLGASTPGAQALQAQRGRPFTFGNGLYSVEKTDRVAELKQGGTSLTASGSFFLVFLSVTNQGQEPLSFSPSDFSLHDQQGRKFTVHSEATKLASLTNQKSDLFSEALQPGLGRETVLVFDVPKESTGLSLRLSNGYLDVSLGQ